MLTIDKSYVLREETERPYYVQVYKVTDNEVIFFRVGGGDFQRVLPRTEFFDKFRHLSEAEILQINGTYAPINVTLGDEPTTVLQGYSNGMVWNGWEMPAFTKETLDNEIENGSFFAAESGYLLAWHEPVQSYLLFTAEYDEDAPLAGFSEALKALNLNEIVPSAPTEPLEMEVGNYNLRIEYVPHFDAMIDGEIKTLYAIGDGWTWEKALSADPEPETPTPGM